MSIYNCPCLNVSVLFDKQEKQQQQHEQSLLLNDKNEAEFSLQNFLTHNAIRAIEPTARSSYNDMTALASLFDKSNRILKTINRSANTETSAKEWTESFIQVVSSFFGNYHARNAKCQYSI